MLKARLESGQPKARLSRLPNLLTSLEPLPKLGPIELFWPRGKFPNCTTVCRISQASRVRSMAQNTSKKSMFYVKNCDYPSIISFEYDAAVPETELR